MTDEEILQIAVPIFRKVFEDPTLVITRDLDASKIEKWDSLNHIVLILELEKLFGVTFTTDELASMANVGDFIEIVKKKKGGSN